MSNFKTLILQKVKKVNDPTNWLFSLENLEYTSLY